MKRDRHKTDVIFFFERGDAFNHFEIERPPVFAYFPRINEGPGVKRMYAHIGQHSLCAVQYAKECIKCTKEKDYKDLKKELEDLGYNLNILN